MMTLALVHRVRSLILPAKTTCDPALHAKKITTLNLTYYVHIQSIQVQFKTRLFNK